MEVFVGNRRSISYWRYLTLITRVGTASATNKYKGTSIKKIEYRELLVLFCLPIDLLISLRWTPPYSFITTSTKRIGPLLSSLSTSSQWKTNLCTFCWLSTRTLTMTSFSMPWIWLIAFEVPSPTKFQMSFVITQHYSRWSDINQNDESRSKGVYGWRMIMV